jgi:hypothetical protein
MQLPYTRYTAQEYIEANEPGTLEFVEDMGAYLTDLEGQAFALVDALGAPIDPEGRYPAILWDTILPPL